MFGIKRKRKPPEHVAPDLPITPMLDMTFQLMAFFIFTFQPQKPEAQFLTPLPTDTGGGINAADPFDRGNKQILIKAQVDASLEGATKGQIKNIEITVLDLPGTPANAAPPKFVIDPAGSTFEAKFQERLTELKKTYEDQYGKTVTIKDKTTHEDVEKPLLKLQLEIDREMVFGSQVMLQDIALRAGYTDITPTAKAEKKGGADEK